MSSRGEDGSKSRRRPALSPEGMSPEDWALWDYVTRDVHPTRAKPRVRVPAEFAAAVDTAVESRPPKPAAKRATLPAPSPAKVAPPRPQPPSTRSPEPVRPIVLERRKARRIARGAEEIDARLDLHGLTQDEAHRALGHFLRWAHADGLRTVIVITGKGGPQDEGSGSEAPYARRERGVLRRMVPLWLDGEGLRGIVIGYSNAHLRHGGGGALYVMLRRPGR